MNGNTLQGIAYMYFFGWEKQSQHEVRDLAVFAKIDIKSDANKIK